MWTEWAIVLTRSNTMDVHSHINVERRITRETSPEDIHCWYASDKCLAWHSTLRPHLSPSAHLMVYLSPNKLFIALGPSLNNKWVRADYNHSAKISQAAYPEQVKVFITCKNVHPASVQSINIVVASEALVWHSNNTKMVIFGDHHLPCALCRLATSVSA